MPVSAKDGGVESITVNRQNWTGVTFDGNSKEEHSNINGDDPVKNMFDNYLHNLYHSDYSANIRASLPVYIFIDLNGTEEFKGFTQLNRNKNDAVKHYEFYVNSTDQNLIPDSNTTGGYTKDLETEGWTKVHASTSTNYLNRSSLNTVEFESAVTGSQIVIKVLETYEDVDTSTEGWQSYVTCRDFNLLKNIEQESAQPIDRTNWSAKSYSSYNVEDYEQNHASEGNPAYLIDGKENTLWHTSYTNHVHSDKQANKQPPFYLVFDMDNDGAGSEEFQAFTYTNRVSSSNGVVENYKLYYT